MSRRDELIETINTAIYGNVMRSAISELVGMLIQDIDGAVNGYSGAQDAADQALTQADTAAGAAHEAAETANAIIAAMGDIVLAVGGSQPAPIPGKKVLWFTPSEV